MQKSLADNTLLYKINIDTKFVNLKSFTGHAFHGYVLKVSDILNSPSKIKYFNATMYDGYTDQSIISYNLDLHPTIETAKQQEKVLKVSNFTKEVDPHINATKLKLSYQAQAELSTV